MLDKEIEELKSLSKELLKITKIVKDMQKMNRLKENIQLEYLYLQGEYRKAQFEFRKKAEQENNNLERKARDIQNQMYTMSHEIEKNFAKDYNISLQYEDTICTLYGLRSGGNFALTVNGKNTGNVLIEHTSPNPYANEYLPREMQFYHYFKTDYEAKQKQANELRSDPDVYEYMYVCDRKLEEIVGYKKGIARDLVEKKFDRELNKIAKRSEKVREYIEIKNYLDDNKFAYQAVNEAFKNEQKNVDNIMQMGKEIESIDAEIDRNKKYVKKFMYIAVECDEWMGADATEKIENICEEWK